MGAGGGGCSVYLKLSKFVELGITGHNWFQSHSHSKIYRKL